MKIPPQHIGISATTFIILSLAGCAQFDIMIPDDKATCDIQLHDERPEQANIVRYHADYECHTQRPLVEAVAAAACKSGITGRGALTELTLRIHTADSGVGQPEGQIQLQMDDGRTIRAIARAAPLPTYSPGYANGCQVGVERLLEALATEPKMTQY